MIDPQSQPITYAQIGVGAIAIEDGKILLIKRGRPPYTGMWSLPGGKLLFGESIAQAIVREVREETGLEVEVGPYAGILESIHAEGEWHYVIVDHLVKIVGGELAADDDAADARWFPLADVTRLDTTPLLIESLTRFGVLG